MRGFKSFKFAEMVFPNDFACLAGPNGSGKSNVCDAIRFAFGETSLKALRAKKVKDLISHNATMAEVTLTLDGSEKHEIKRAIRNDGKIMYRLNGKRTTRTSILSLLKKFNIDESGRNTIAQGEINHIITMSAKDRREIIDSIAGISEFENKKREAMKDLEVVETRLRETALILGEKIGMLNELEKELKIALDYLENKKKFNNARGSIIKNDIEKFTTELEKAICDMQKLNNSIKAKQIDLAELETKINALEAEKKNYLDEIQAKQQQSAVIKKIENIKLIQVKDGQEMEEKKNLVARFECEISALKDEMKKERDELAKTECEFKKADEELNLFKSQHGEMKFISESKLREITESQKAKLISLNESRVRVEAEINASEQLINEKKCSLTVQTNIDNKATKEKITNEVEILKGEINQAKEELEAFFEEEKEKNAKIAELDKQILSLREKIAALKAQNPRLASSAVMGFINQIKMKKRDKEKGGGGGSGVHGALIDLIKFDAKYANAIEAAAGPRLLYIVVDNADIATKLITQIKEAGVGRATFIPLKEVKAHQIILEDGMHQLLDYIDYDSEIEKAVQYAFGETLLVPNMEHAKKTWFGKQRMVTLDGEIFEKSGVITGGKTAGIATTGALSKLESEIAEHKSTREAMFAELARVRDQMSSTRAMRTEKEIRAKSLEIELTALCSEDEKLMHEYNENEKKKAEIDELKSKIKSLFLKKEEFEKEISLLSEKIAANEKNLALEIQQLSKQNEELAKRHANNAARISSLETKRNGLFNEIAIRKTNIYKLELRIKQTSEEKNSYLSKIYELERRVNNQKDDLTKYEEEFASSSKELEILFKKMKESEEKTIELGKQKGAISFENDKFNKELNLLSIKKATSETKLIDLKTEFDSLKEFEFMAKPREELLEIAKTAEAFLSTNQNVNLASIELYERKKSEIEGVKEKMETLRKEKGAIFNMIEEIDLRKKETFFNTLYSVNDNFKKMFKHIPHVGEGYVYLDKPNEPFESGLFLKIKRGIKEIGIESLSGGENSLVALMFIFALQFVKPSPYYILDEVDSALDEENSKNLAKLIKEISKNSQFVLVTHNNIIMTFASAVFGVSKSDGISKIVGIKLSELEKDGD